VLRFHWFLPYLGQITRSTEQAGIQEFVLSGHPHLGEASWFGEDVLPELARRGLWEHPASAAARDGRTGVTP
jgi:alkanesulfonate monooxygenase